MDTYQGTIFDPTSLHKYLYANANPVMYIDPSGYFTLGEMNSASSINSILDNSANMSSQFALKFFKKFMKKVAIGTIGGLIAVGDQLSAGITDPEQLAIAFRKGFLTGLAFSFMSGKVAMALGALGTIGGFAGSVKSFSDGNFWQGVYRLSLSALGSVGLYKNYVSNRTTNINTGTRFRRGEPVKPIEKTIDMMLDKETYANAVADKYGINLKGSGQKITIKYDSSLVSGQYGRTLKSEPNVIRVGGDAFMSEEELAVTIAHELNHARSWLKGGDAPEETAYAIQEALRDFILGGR